MFDVIFESPASTVYKTSRVFSEKDGSSSTRLLAVKSGSSAREYTPEPHDIVKEARILLRLHHPNIIDVVHAGPDSTRPDVFSIWMPFCDHTVQDLLDSPLFAPHHPFLQQEERLSLDSFLSVARCIISQMLSAIAYLHHPVQGIGHRDIKPANFLLTRDGYVKLIDFGISYELNAKDRTEDLWPERADELYVQVSTGSYRAPELLFGAQDYDLRAMDLWSLGCTLAEFFTPVRMQRTEDDDEDELFDEDAASTNLGNGSHAVPAGHEPSLHARWRRGNLFDASRGEIGLTWSIFQTRGTPTENTWPGFHELPNARRLQFKDAAEVSLRTLLPNLPSAAMGDHVLDLVDRLLAYPPTDRLAASDALQHAFFAGDPPLSSSSGEVKEEERQTVVRWIDRCLR